MELFLADPIVLHKAVIDRDGSLHPMRASNSDMVGDCKPVGLLVRKVF